MFVSHVIKGEGASVPPLEPGQWVLKGHPERLICDPFSLGDTVGRCFILTQKM